MFRNAFFSSVLRIPTGARSPKLLPESTVAPKSRFTAQDRVLLDRSIEERSSPCVNLGTTLHSSARKRSPKFRTLNTISWRQWDVGTSAPLCARRIAQIGLYPIRKTFHLTIIVRYVN